SSLSVPNTNAFFVAPVAGLKSETVTYDFDPVLGPYEVPLVSQSGQILGGFDIKLPAGWRAEITGSYGRSDDLQKPTHQLDSATLTKALASSDPTTALDVFGGPATSAST